MSKLPFLEVYLQNSMLEQKYQESHPFHFKHFFETSIFLISLPFTRLIYAEIQKQFEKFDKSESL